MYNPPTDESIKFPVQKDTFPTVYNAGSTSIADRYTKVWAEYHNKIRNFIGIVEPMCSSNTASDPSGSLKRITYWRLNPAPSLAHILYGNAKMAYDLGKAPPSMVLPFEIVITNSLDNYDNWPKLRGTLPMLYYASSTDLNNITKTDFMSSKPLVQCTLRKGTEISTSSPAPTLLVNSYCIPGTDTLLIRGAVIDPLGTPFVTTTLPSLSKHFQDIENIFINVSLVGVR